MISCSCSYRTITQNSLKMSFIPKLCLLIFFLFIINSFAQAKVPPSSTFRLVNQGDFGDYIVEYDGNYRTLDVFSSPFQLCFYNTTPNAYTLALRMGLVRSESLFRWVWEANRGSPVGENATFALGTDGNLLLAEADGRIVWQTNTTNKGVVGFKLLPNGNMVLHDAKGNFIWQSFDYPTDTLLVGQSLRLGGSTKLVSRVSAQVNSNGPYTLVMEPKVLAMYYKSPKPLLYLRMLDLAKSSLKEVTFSVSPENDDNYAYDITFAYKNMDGSTGGNAEIARPKYNATLSILRLGVDGNLRVYTYSDKVDWAAWEVTFTLFARNSPYALWDTECQLPEKCGKFGLCEDSQCVACPTPKGLLGWSNKCEQPKPSCGSNTTSYYKLQGVDHFLSKFTKGDGPMTTDACGLKCTKDCKCLGYFYNQETSRCWIAYDILTITKVSNIKHVGYIKV